ncbi:MAG: aspartate--tRNA ligase [Candidatus Woesearchaeota archaeon]
MLRTINCGEMRKKHVGKKAEISGWVHSVRDHGGIKFIDVRDKYGVTQVVMDKIPENIGREFVVHLSGKVRLRDKETYNPKIPTGEVELYADSIEILSKSKHVPFEISDDADVRDETRMRYRFLDLRRPKMQHNLFLRHKANLAARKALDKHSFVEYETPNLVRSTPEGARDFIVPSRIHPGKCYALPQSPQLYKQILMVSGADRYFQFARCFRDEDLRADRQLEHTQLDMEMSFAEKEDVMKVVEDFTSSICEEVFDKKIKTPFAKMTYAEALESYGTDKPDLRYGLKIKDVTDIVKDSDFSVFKEVISSGGTVKLLNPELVLTRAELDNYISYVKSIGGKGMAWMTNDGELSSNIVKYFPESVKKGLLSESSRGTLLFIADEENKALELAGKLRTKIAEGKVLFDKNEKKFCWITDFPLFSWNDDTERWDPEHHMFTMPREDTIKYLEKKNFDPGKVLSESFDFVLNGVELASGSKRICDTELQHKIMKIVGYTDDEIEERFGFLIDIFKYGAPPHAGIGIGFDRLVALMLGYDDIREVITFPKNKSAESLIDKSPGPMRQDQLKELRLKLDMVKKK